MIPHNGIGALVKRQSHKMDPSTVRPVKTVRWQLAASEEEGTLQTLNL